MAKASAKRTRPLKRPLRQGEDPAKLPKLPKDVPEWVRNEFEDFPELAEREHLLKAIRSSEISATTWRTIYELESARLASADLTFYEKSLRSFLKPLANFIDRSVAAAHQTRISMAERKKIVDRIQKACKGIERDLAKIDLESDQWLPNVAGPGANEELVPIVEYALSNPSLILRALSATSLLWLESISPAGRPGAKGAAKLAFLRSLHAGLLRRYGKRLPSATLQICAAFHPEVRKMGPSDVTKAIERVVRK